jgi:hypothetical protein
MEKLWNTYEKLFFREIATRSFSEMKPIWAPGQGSGARASQRGACQSIIVYHNCSSFLIIHSCFIHLGIISLQFIPFNTWGAFEITDLPRFYKVSQCFRLYISDGGKYDGPQLEECLQSILYQKSEYCRRYDGSPWESNRWNGNLINQIKFLWLLKTNQTRISSLFTFWTTLMKQLWKSYAKQWKAVKSYEKLCKAVEKLWKAMKSYEKLWKSYETPMKSCFSGK